MSEEQDESIVKPLPPELERWLSNVRDGLEPGKEPIIR